jgi:hypothetical protein
VTSRKPTTISAVPRNDLAAPIALYSLLTERGVEAQERSDVCKMLVMLQDTEEQRDRLMEALAVVAGVRLAPPPSVEMLMERGFNRYEAERIMLREQGHDVGCCRKLTVEEAAALDLELDPEDYESPEEAARASAGSRAVSRPND